MTQDGTAAAFDKRAAGYHRNSWHLRYAHRLVELAAPAPGSRVLDAATGTGFAAIAAARTAGHVTGVDISPGMLDQARQSITAAGLTNIELVRGDATALPRFADASFDVILCSAGLLYLPVAAALREWHRLLVPGGRVGFSAMRADFPLSARLFRRHARRHGLDLTDPMVPLGAESRCAWALHDAGFTPAALIAETIRFDPADLEHAWEAHIHGPYHDEIAALGPDQARAFEREYTSALQNLLRTDETALLNPRVIYAFGRKPR